MAKPNTTSPIYPWKQYYRTGKSPGVSSDRKKVIEKVVKKGYPQFAAIIEAVCKQLDLPPETLSTYYFPLKAPTTPAARAYSDALKKKYAKAIAKHLVNVQLLSGMGLGDAELEKGVQKAAVQELAKVAAQQVGQQVAIQAAGQTAAQAVPYGAVAATVVQLVMDYKSVIGSAEGRVNAGFAVAGAAATCASVPFAGWIAAIGIAAYGAFKYFKGKKEAEKEKDEWKHYVKMIKSMINLAVLEAKKLAPAAAAKGAKFKKAPSSAFLARLRKHHEMLIKCATLDGQLAKAKAKSQKTGKPAKPIWTKVEQVHVGKNQTLQLFLQLARDLHVLNAVVKAIPSKVAFDVEKEVSILTEQIVNRVPAMPYQMAATLALEAVKAYGAPMPQELRNRIVEEMSAKAGGKTYNEIVGAGGGGGLLAVGALLVGGVAVAAGAGKG